MLVHPMLLLLFLIHLFIALSSRKYTLGGIGGQAQ